MKESMDEIDISLLDGITRNPGCCVSDVIKPLLRERSESVLRSRVRALEIRKLIRFIPTKHKVLLYQVSAAEADLEKSDSPGVTSTQADTNDANTTARGIHDRKGC